MLYFLIAAAIIAGDQFFKHWIVANLSQGASMKLLPGIVRLTYVRNEGISFGILKGMTLPVVIFTVIICAIIVWMFVTKRFKIAGEKLGAMLVLGGAIGNVIDRIVYGFVVDMFQPEFVNFAIFNVADIAITFGCLVFCISFLVGDIRARRFIMAFRSQKRDEAAEKSLMEALSAFKPQNAPAEPEPAATESEIEAEPKAAEEPSAEPQTPESEADDPGVCETQEAEEIAPAEEAPAGSEADATPDAEADAIAEPTPEPDAGAAEALQEEDDAASDNR